MDDILELPIYVKTHVSPTKSFSIPIWSQLTTPAHMLNGYEICLNSTNWFSICNMSDTGCVPPFWTVLVTWYPHYDAGSLADVSPLPFQGLSSAQCISHITSVLSIYHLSVKASNTNYHILSIFPRYPICICIYILFSPNEFLF